MAKRNVYGVGQEVVVVGPTKRYFGEPAEVKYAYQSPGGEGYSLAYGVELLDPKWEGKKLRLSGCFLAKPDSDVSGKADSVTKARLLKDYRSRVDKEFKDIPKKNMWIVWSQIRKAMKERYEEG